MNKRDFLNSAAPLIAPQADNAAMDAAQSDPVMLDLARRLVARLDNLADAIGAQNYCAADRLTRLFLAVSNAAEQAIPGADAEQMTLACAALSATVVATGEPGRRAYLAQRFMEQFAASTVTVLVVNEGDQDRVPRAKAGRA